MKKRTPLTGRGRVTLSSQTREHGIGLRAKRQSRKAVPGPDEFEITADRWAKYQTELSTSLSPEDSIAYLLGHGSGEQDGGYQLPKPVAQLLAGFEQPGRKSAGQGGFALNVDSRLQSERQAIRTEITSLFGRLAELRGATARSSSERQISFHALDGNTGKVFESKIGGNVLEFKLRPEKKLGHGRRGRDRLPLKPALVPDLEDGKSNKLQLLDEFRRANEITADELVALSSEIAASEQGSDTLVADSLPATPPEFYRDRPAGENIVAFLRRAWSPWIEQGVLTRPYLLHVDPQLYYALAQWLRKNEIPADLIIPTKSQILSAEVADKDVVREARRLVQAVARRSRREPQ